LSSAITSARHSINPRCIIAGPPLRWRYSALSFGCQLSLLLAHGHHSMLLLPTLTSATMTVIHMGRVVSSVAGGWPPLLRVWVDWNCERPCLYSRAVLKLIYYSNSVLFLITLVTFSIFFHRHRMSGAPTSYRGNVPAHGGGQPPAEMNNFGQAGEHGMPAYHPRPAYVEQAYVK
jgi:hypothetical protein